MQIHARGETDVGRSRSHNEDTILVDPGLGLYVVCDGMGGHAAGEVASAMAAAAVQKFIATNGTWLAQFDGSQAACESVEGLLRTAIQSASAEIFEFARAGQGRHGMGTTCVALLTAGGKAFMGHVGDSRMYMVREGRLWQLSEDHTFANEAIRNGMMSVAEAKASRYANLVTRGVGVQESVAVDILVFDFVENDTILLCSDGLHGYYEDAREMAAMLVDPDLDGLPSHLIAVANDRGGGDNLSAVIVRGVPELPALPDDATRRVQVTTNLKTLRHIALFMDLADAELVRVFNRFKPVDFAPGDTVIREGESADSLYVIVEGEVTVTRAGKSLAKLGRGAHVGEMGLLNQRPRTATVTTTTPAHVLVLGRDAFNEVIREDTVLAAKLLYKLAQILSLRLDEHIGMADTADAVERKTKELGVLSPFRRRR